MATWKLEEMEIIRNYLSETRNALTKEDHENIRTNLPHRSLAAIKKKCLELKHNRVPNCQPNKWTQEELQRLVNEYTTRDETQIGERLKAIKHMFPGRSEKAMATKLRETNPNAYYMRATPEEQSDPEAMTSMKQVMTRKIPRL